MLLLTAYDWPPTIRRRILAEYDLATNYWPTTTTWRSKSLRWQQDATRPRHNHTSGRPIHALRHTLSPLLANLLRSSADATDGCSVATPPGATKDPAGRRARLRPVLVQVEHARVWPRQGPHIGVAQHPPDRGLDLQKPRRHLHLGARRCGVWPVSFCAFVAPERRPCVPPVVAAVQAICGDPVGGNDHMGCGGPTTT